jgi:hypothetical protein
MAAPTCSTAAVPIVINYLTYAIPVMLLGTATVMYFRNDILGGIINKPNYQKYVAFSLNSATVFVMGVVLLIAILYLLGPILLPPEFAVCVSPLA